MTINPAKSRLQNCIDNLEIDLANALNSYDVETNTEKKAELLDYIFNLRQAIKVLKKIKEVY